MLVSGYRLREAIKVWTLRHSALASQFDGSLKKFPGEDKPSPVDVAKAVAEAESAIAHLQTAMAFYGLQVKVTVMAGMEIPLLQAVKLVGGAGRAEKMWRSAASEKRDPYATNRDERDAASIIAARTITLDDALARAKDAAIYAGKLRSAIAEGNGKQVDIPFLDPKLLDF